MAQFEFLKSIRDKVDETHDAIRHIRSVKSQSFAPLKRLDDTFAIFEEARARFADDSSGGGPLPN